MVYRETPIEVWFKLIMMEGVAYLQKASPLIKYNGGFIVQVPQPSAFSHTTHQKVRASTMYKSHIHRVIKDELTT